MRTLYFLSFSFLIFSPQVFACDISEPEVSIKRASDAEDHCIDLYVRYSKKAGDLVAWSPKLVGNFNEDFSFSASLGSQGSVESNDHYVSFFCLSEEALKVSKITIRYSPIVKGDGSVSTCAIIKEVENFPELLKINDESSSE